MNILVLTTEQNFVWTSMQEIIPGIVKVWEEGLLADVLNVDELDIKRDADKFMRADVLVVTAFNLNIHKTLKIANEVFHFSGRMYFYLHNFSTIAAWPLFKWDALKYFHDSDIFVTSCERDAELLKKVFPSVNCIKTPFWLEPDSSVKKIERSPHDPFVFIGRISRQKNLHQLIVAFSHYKKKTDTKRKLIFFGKEDDLGSPNMEINGNGYLNELKELISDLGLEDWVEFRGFVERDKIYREINQKDYILIVPSLHSDENFGMAAYKALLDGKRCILTDWGGHTDYKVHFSEQVQYLSVYESHWGPELLLEEIVQSLEVADELKSVNPHQPDYYKFENIIAELEKSLEFTISNKPINVSQLAKEVFKARESFSSSDREYTSTKIFNGYDDKLAKPFFKSYGMEGQLTTSVVKRAYYSAYPWVKIEGGQVLVLNPHKGELRLKFEEGPAQTSLGGMSYELCEKLLGYNALYMDGRTKLTGKLFPDRCQTSISLLREKVSKYFKEKGWETPQFADDFLKFEEEAKEVENIVLFGGYVNRILDSGNWPFKKMRLFVISSKVKQALCTLFKIPEEAIAVIPRYELYQKRKANLPNLSKANFVYAGRISRVKNITLLIRTINELQKKMSISIPLKLIGSFDEEIHDYAGISTICSYEEEINNLINSLEWIEKPVIVERMAHDEWPKEMDDNSVYISLSSYLSEDYAVSIAQAQEQKRAVVASDWGGHSDLEGSVLKIPMHMILPLGEEENLAPQVAAFIKEHWFEKEVVTSSKDEKLPTEVHIEDLDRLRRAFCLKYGSQVLGLTKGFGPHFAESDEGKLLYNKWVKSLGNQGEAESWYVLEKGTKIEMPEGSYGIMHASDLAHGDNLKRLCLASQVILLYKNEQVENALVSLMGKERVKTPFRK